MTMTTSKSSYLQERIQRTKNALKRDTLYNDFHLQIIHHHSLSTVHHAKMRIVGTLEVYSQAKPFSMRSVVCACVCLPE